MEIKDINQKDLKEGIKIIFVTPDNQDDYREATIGFNKRIGSFTILFNGGYIHTSVTFKSMIKRLEILKKKWSLSFKKIETDND